MFRHLNHTEIDKHRWDKCVETSLSGSVYGMSWYLDCVSPGWQGLILDDYTAVFPLPVKRKLGLKYLVQPYFAQQFSVYGNAVDSILYQKVLDFVSRHYKYSVLCLNEEMAMEVCESELVKQMNFELSLNASYQELFEGYSRHNKRNVKASYKNNLEIKQLNDKDDFIDFYVSNLKKILKGVKPLFWDTLTKIVNNLDENGNGEILGVYSEGKLISASCIVKTNRRIYLLANASNEVGRKKRGQNFLFDYVIRQYAESDLVLDFEGSNIPSIAYFFEGFGAVKTTYFSMLDNNLPWWIKWMKR